MRLPRLFLIVSILTMGGCKRDVEKLIDCEEVALHSRADFKIGVAVETNRLAEKTIYRDKLLLHFNSITPENAFKWENLNPSFNYYYWKEADELIEFATKNALDFHGHTLVWGEQVPAWLSTYPGDLRDLFRKHIITVVGRYRGKVKAWDVVNEAFEDDGSMKDNIWRQKIGDDYIALAFQYAREADPDALLFYNDYNLESKSKKMEAVLDMTKDFKERGIPIDGIGLQMHVAHNYPTNRQIKGTLNCFCETGLKVHISEMDVAINGRGTHSEPTFRLLKEQKKRVETIVEAYNELSPENKYAITMWGISDSDSWLRKKSAHGEWPLLFDDEYKIKPAFCGFIDGLR